MLSVLTITGDFMHVYNATVRLNGELNHEVAKRGLTTPEILILNKIHGGAEGKGGVVNIRHAGTVPDFDDMEERERLEYTYDPGLANLHEDLRTSVKKMFSEFGALPTVLRDYAGPLCDEENELEEFQKSLPFKSPNSLSVAEERKLRKEERKQARNVQNPEVTAAQIPAKGLNPPRGNNTKRTSSSAIDAVL